MRNFETLFIQSAVILLAVCTSVSAVAESDWPPFAEELRNHLSSQLGAFEAIEARMNRESLLTIDANLLWQVQGRRRINGEIERENLDDAFSWLDELVPLRVNSILNMRGSYYFSYAKRVVVDETEFDVKFWHGATAGMPECSSSYAVADCGFCGDILSDEWAVIFDWEPMTFTEDLMEGVDSLDAATFMSRSKEARDACVAEGLTKMEVAAEALNSQ